RYTHTATVRDARRYAHIDCFRAAYSPFAITSLAHGAQLAGAAAAIARHVEFHFAGGLLQLSCAVADRAGLRSSDGVGTMAGLASVQPRDLQFLDRAAHSIPEIDFDLIFEVAPRFALFSASAAASSATEELAKKIAEGRATPRASTFSTEIEATKIEVDVASAVAGVSGAARTRRGVVAVANVAT